MKIVNIVLQVYFLACLLFSSFAFSADGTVNISGSFRDNACVLALDDESIDVPFGDISASRFTTAGAIAATVTFTIHLEECGVDVSNVDVTFSGTPDSSDSQLLALGTDGDAATGLAIAILDASKQRIPLEQASVNYALSPGDVPLVFYAQLLSTRDVVTAGDVNASATFSFHYE